MVGTEFAVEPLLERHAGALARVHREVCPYYPSSKLGLGFCRSFYRMYASTPDAFGFGAWRGRQAVGLAIGCSPRVQEVIRRELRVRAALAVILRPWVVWDKSMRRRIGPIDGQRGLRPRPGAPRHEQSCGPLFVTETGNIASAGQGSSPCGPTGTRLVRLVNIGVISDVRRLGVASALMQAFLAESGRRGYTLVELNVAPDNAPARRFYERHGWHYDDTATPPGSESLRYVIAIGDRAGGDVPCPPPAT